MRRQGSRNRNRNAPDHNGKRDRPKVGSVKRVQDVKNEIHKVTTKTAKLRDNVASDRNLGEIVKLQPTANVLNADRISENVNHGDKKLNLAVVRATPKIPRPR